MSVHELPIRAARHTLGGLAEMEVEQAEALLTREMFQAFSSSESSPYATLADFAPVWGEAMEAAGRELSVARAAGVVTGEQSETLAASLLMVAAGSRAILRLLAGAVVLPEGTWLEVVARIIEAANPEVPQ